MTDSMLRGKIDRLEDKIRVLITRSASAGPGIANIYRDIFTGATNPVTLTNTPTTIINVIRDGAILMNTVDYTLSGSDLTLNVQLFDDSRIEVVYVSKIGSLFSSYWCSVSGDIHTGRGYIS